MDTLFIKYKRLNLVNQYDMINNLKKFTYLLEKKYNDRLSFINKYNTNISNLDIYLFTYISYFIDNYYSIIILSQSCKTYYKELIYLLKNSKNILSYSFKLTYNLNFLDIFTNSYFNFNSLKYTFNLSFIPYNNNISFINNYFINNTLLIYNHFFYDHYNHNYLINTFFNNIFYIKYENNENLKNIIFDYTKFNKLSKLFYLEDDVYIFYNYNVIQYKNSDYINHYDCISLNRKCFKNDFTLWLILLFINNKKYKFIIDIFDDFDYNNILNINLIDKFTQNIVNIINSNLYSKNIKEIILLICLNIFHNFIKNTQNIHNIDDIFHFVNIIYDYYNNNITKKKPKYYKDFIEEKYNNIVKNIIDIY